MMPYERFTAWQLAHALALEIYQVTAGWPPIERYQLTAQTRRAALSVPANIAEGAAKRGSREFRRYLGIALGSLSELSYLLLFARDRHILPSPEWQRLDERRGEVSRTTYGLLYALRPPATPRTTHDPGSDGSTA